MVVGRSKIAAGIRGGRAGGADLPDEATGMRAVADPRRLRRRLSSPSSRTVSQAGADDGSGKNRQVKPPRTHPSSLALSITSSSGTTLLHTGMLLSSIIKYY